MNLQEILSQPEGFCPPSVTVKVEKVFPRKAGESENGPWSFQSVKTSDGELKLKNLDVFPEDRVGQTVTLRAYPSKKHGLTGLKVAHEEYQGKTYNKLVVTPTAIWEWAEPHGNGYAPAKSNGHKPDTKVEYEAPQRYDSERFKTHLLGCADVAVELITALSLMDDQAKQACFATVCIDAQRHNIILGDSKPSEPLKSDSDNGRKEALLKGVRSACKLLNDEGYDPPFTPKMLDEYVNEIFDSTTGISGLSADDTEDVIQRLSEKLDNFRLNKSILDDVDDPENDPNMPF